MIIVEIVTGLGVGFVVGLLSGLFKFIKLSSSKLIILKAVWCLFISVGLVVAATLTHFKGSKYIAALTFGYVSFRFWGDHKPA